MYIAVTIKKYRAVKEVGKIKMSVGIIVYYQLMQVCQVLMQRDEHFYPKKAVPPLVSQVGGDHMHIPVASAFGAVLPPAAKPPAPSHGVEFQPSEVCPKNFLIIDQTDHRSQIMFHPAFAHKFNGPSLNFRATYIQDNFKSNDTTNVVREMSSSFKEDSDDIDALLSLEEGEEEEYDEEEVSTARTRGNYGSNSPDSSSTYGSEPQHSKSSSMLKSSGSSSKCNNERKRQKMKKTVNVLRGIVPGGNEMNTVAVLDEAVKYLKSLKVEAQNLGVRNFKN